jgi:peptide/nickel transport system substrate-binding protein
MEKKITRKDFLKTVVFGAFGAAAAGCASQATPETVIVTQEVQVPVKETVVVTEQVQNTVKETVVVPEYQGGLPVPRNEVCIINETTVFRVFDKGNPFAPNAIIQSGYDQLIAARLMYLNWATGESINLLVEGYEYSSDYKTMTLTVRKGVKWNDGEAFTAKDIKFTIEMLKANPNLGWSSTMNQWVASVDAPDDFTVIFNLTDSNARFHWNFKQAWSCPIVAEHEWSGQDPTTYAAFPIIGTGPYKFHSAVPELRMLVFERVENWWGTEVLGYDPGAPYMIWQTSPPPDAEIQDLADNFIDHAHSYSSDKNLLDQSVALNPEVVLAPWRDPCPRGIWFNCGKYPLSKPEVRTAMFHCVDKKKAATSLYPWPTVPANYPWADWGGNDQYNYQDILDKYDADASVSYDLDKANQILDDLGFMPGSDGIRVDDQGNKMEFSIIVPQVGVTGEYPIGLDFAENLGKVGITASVKFQEMTPWNDALALGEFDISSHWWCGNWQEPPFFLGTTWQTKNMKPIGERDVANNWIRFSDPELDALAPKMEVTSPDDPAIKDMYKQAFEIFIKNMVSIPVIQTTFVMPFDTHYWKGWPDENNIYAVPFTWWTEFQFVLYQLKAAAM